MQTLKNIAASLQIDLIHPFPTSADVEQFLDAAIELKPAAVRVPPVFVAFTAQRLTGLGIAVATTIGGKMNKSTVKAIATTSAIKDGATEVEIELFPTPLATGDVEAMKIELMEIVRAARATRRDAILKVLINANWLMSARGENGIESALRGIREGAGDAALLFGDPSEVRIARTHGHCLILQAIGYEQPVERVQELLQSGAERVSVHFTQEPA